MIPKSNDSAIQVLLNVFWFEMKGKEQYEASKELRDANGIPDSQWFKAQLMNIIDEAEITYGTD